MLNHGLSVWFTTMVRPTSDQPLWFPWLAEAMPRPELLLPGATRRFETFRPKAAGGRPRNGDRGGVKRSTRVRQGYDKGTTMVNDD